MLFNSPTYWFFILLLALVYYIIPKRFRIILLLGSSAYFYYSWNNYFLTIVVFSILVDFVCGFQIHKTNTQRKKKIFLWMSVILNIGLLFSFKYYNFFATNINNLFSWLDIAFQMSESDLPFPVGISFYTFQTLSYTLDIYKRRIKPEPSLFKFSLYVLLFPQLLAGPIERARTLLPQISQLQKNVDFDNIRFGFRLILWGLFKKMVIADRLSEYVDAAYKSPEEYAGFPLMLASCLFMVQVFCDFSGYTDIAIGSARLFGIKLSDNFTNRVYFANSTTNFWKGWHITLTNWFRDYLYFNLIGRSKSQFRFYSGILVVYVLTGLWHGAGWGYIVWGVVNGINLIIERLSYDVRMKWFERIGLLQRPALLNSIAILYIFVSNAFTSVWFRAKNFSQALEVLHYSWNPPQWSANFPLKTNQQVILICLLISMDTVNHFMGNQRFDAWLSNKKSWIRFLFYFVLIELILNFGEFRNDEFFYFRF